MTQDRLSLRTVSRLPARLRPAYDPADVRVGVVHLGVGAFHRAHQAVVLDDRLAAGERDWAVLGASLRSADTADALRPQDGLYAVAVRAGGPPELRVIGALRELVVAPELGGRERLLAAMASAAVRIVTLTVTEKGYNHDPATGELDEASAAVRADLATPRAPATAPGLIVEALRRRREAGVAPFAVVPCDNLPANGATVRRVVSRFASLVDADLGAFVAGEVAFPSTMVDRIVPATTPEDRASISAALGLDDAWPVATEPFTQWVVEDRFPSGRPRLEEAGVQMVGDVAPFETMKLRLLNGSHSTMAYLGRLAGHETIADVITDEPFAALVSALMREEIAPTLPPVPGQDLGAYQAALKRRFANPSLRHKTLQVAMDGSQKLPQRLLAPARERLERGEPIARIALAVAGWMRFVAGTDERGAAIPLDDPLAGRLRALANEAGPEPARLAPALASLEAVFGRLGSDPRFLAPVTAALESLTRHGARETARRAASPAA